MLVLNVSNNIDFHNKQTDYWFLATRHLKYIVRATVPNGEKWVKGGTFFPCQNILKTERTKMQWTSNLLRRAVLYIENSIGDNIGD